MKKVSLMCLSMMALVGAGCKARNFGDGADTAAKIDLSKSVFTIKINDLNQTSVRGPMIRGLGAPGNFSVVDSSGTHGCEVVTAGLLSKSTSDKLPIACQSEGVAYVLFSAGNSPESVVSFVNRIDQKQNNWHRCDKTKDPKTVACFKLTPTAKLVVENFSTAPTAKMSVKGSLAGLDINGECAMVEKFGDKHINCKKSLSNGSNYEINFFPVEAPFFGKLIASGIATLQTAKSEVVRYELGCTLNEKQGALDCDEFVVGPITF